jgi:hypothetical protein
MKINVKKQIALLCLMLLFNGIALFANSDFLYGASHTALKIGQSYQGGKIAYILQSDDIGYDAKKPHGLIAAIRDIEGPKSGGFNDEDLKNNDDLKKIDVNNLKDWRMPTRDELITLYKNRDTIGGFLSELYWSSTMTKGIFRGRFGIKFLNGEMNIWTTNQYGFVRPVRTF